MREFQPIKCCGGKGCKDNDAVPQPLKDYAPLALPIQFLSGSQVWVYNTVKNHYEPQGKNPAASDEDCVGAFWCRNLLLSALPLNGRTVNAGGDENIRVTVAVFDNPEKDNTPSAHPAWVRGAQCSFSQMLQVIETATTLAKAAVEADAVSGENGDDPGRSIVQQLLEMVPKPVRNSAAAGPLTSLARLALAAALHEHENEMFRRAQKSLHCRWLRFRKWWRDRWRSCGPGRKGTGR